MKSATSTMQSLPILHSDAILDKYLESIISPLPLLFLLIIMSIPGPLIYRLEAPEYVFMTIATCIQYLSIIPGWTVYFRITNYRWAQHPLLPSTRVLSDACISMYVLCFGVLMILKSWQGECNGRPYNVCNAEAEVLYLPQGVVIWYILALAGLQVVLRCHSRFVILVCYVFFPIALVTSILVGGLWRSWTLGLSVIPLAFQLYENERQADAAYRSLCRQEAEYVASLKATEERHEVEMRSVEMRNLLGNVAHDLKTPMQSFAMDINVLDSVVCTMKSFASCCGKQTDEYLEQLRIGSSSIGALQDTNNFMIMSINRAIDYTKSSSGILLVPSICTFGLRDALQWAVDCVNRSQSRVPIILHDIPSSICPYVMSDKQWLMENILCLTSNAVKFTMEGSIDVQCRLVFESRFETADDSVGGLSDTVVESSGQTDPPVQMLRIEVEDGGIGISPEQRRQLFRPFKQAQSRAGGTGLGLYSLYQRMVSLGGACGVSERHDGRSGSLFWFALPYRPDESIIDVEDGTDSATTSVPSLDMKSRSRGAKLEGSLSGTTFFTPRSTGSYVDDTGDASVELIDSAVDANAFGKKRVLLVEDTFVIQKSTVRALQRAGLYVEVAEHGLAGLNLMKEKHFDVILMDLHMPVMDGVEAVRRIREYEVGTCDVENGKYRHQRFIVATSADNDAKTIEETAAAGMNAFLPKPFSILQLKEICAEHNIDL